MYALRCALTYINYLSEYRQICRFYKFRLWWEHISVVVSWCQVLQTTSSLQSDFSCINLIIHVEHWSSKPNFCIDYVVFWLFCSQSEIFYGSRRVNFKLLLKASTKICITKSIFLLQSVSVRSSLIGLIWLKKIAGSILNYCSKARCRC